MELFGMSLRGRYKAITDMTSPICHVTLEYFYIDMEIGKNNDRGHCNFLKSTCGIGNPISEATTWPSPVLMNQV